MEIIAFGLGLLCGLFLMDKIRKPPETPAQIEEKIREAEEIKYKTRMDREFQNFFAYDGTNKGQIKIEDEKEG